MTADAKLRVGVIGVGAMGANHARVYSRMAGVELIGVADADAATAHRVANICDCVGVAGATELFHLGIDAVSIALPTSLHAGAALDAMSRGVHVLVEKPAAGSEAEAGTMAAAADAAGVCLLVGHIERFNPAVQRLKQCVDDGLLGDVISMSARRVGPYSPRIRDVGIILDLATHDINIMTHLCDGPARTVYATAGSVLHTQEDHAIIVLTFDNGATGVIDTNWLTPHKVRTLTVVGARAVAEVDYVGMTLDIFDGDWRRGAKVEKAEPLQRELEHFVSCCRGGRRPLVSGSDGAHAVAVARAAMESTRTNRALVL
jgi:UDP-N-acetylglucosamine 3-dehydrogenase